MFERFREKLNQIAAYAMPVRLAYWAAIRVITYASVTKLEDEVMSEIKAMDALEHWKESKIDRVETIAPEVRSQRRASY